MFLGHDFVFVLKFLLSLKTCMIGGILTLRWLSAGKLNLFGLFLDCVLIMLDAELNKLVDGLIIIGFEKLEKVDLILLLLIKLGVLSLSHI